MINDSLRQHKENQIKALRRLLTVVLFGVAALLLYQAISINRTQLNYQNEMMASVSRSVLKELTQYLNNQRLKIALFHSNNKAQVENQFAHTDSISESDYVEVLTAIKKEFPSSRLYTIISPEGINLLEHITGEFLPDCKEEVIDTVNQGQQQRLFLHRSKTSTHYDLIIPRDMYDKSKGYFFVAFNIGYIAELLFKYQLPHQQLFLLRNDKTGFIEVSSENSGKLVSSQYLDQKTLADFELSLEIPETRWSFAIRLDPEAKQALLRQALWQSFITWSIVTILLYLAFLLIRRNLESKYLSQLQLDQSRKSAETIINSVNEAVFSVDSEHKITFANLSAAELTEINKVDMIGKNFSDICLLYYLHDERELILSDLIQTFEDNKIPEYSNLNLKLDKHNDIPVAVRLATISKPEGGIDGYTITIENLSTAIELSKRLVFHENKDSLTGLDNRRQLERKLGHLLSEAKTSPGEHQSAIILIDLDKFQLLNTSHGFEAGDEFLKRVAILLSNTILDAYCLSRLSSDEFAVIFDDIDDRQLANVCEKIKTAMRNFEFYWHNERMNSSVCLGVVKIDQNFAHINDVLSAVDHASRLAKTKGSNITQFYQTDDPEIKQHAEDITRYADLQKAINEGRFVLFRQEIRATKKVLDEPQKFEILIRMLDAQGNIVAPFYFLPAAEKYGLMAKIDRWVISNTLNYLARLKDNDTANYNINISSKTLGDKNSVAFVEGLFDEFKIAPERINFEITETSAISYLDNALEFMHAMKSKGCTFSLDDFGTGLASFDYLKKLPIDYLKIDGVFVKDIQSNPIDYAFIQAIHKISSQMGIKTVAEFVENDSIFNLLDQIGVDFVQGYSIHKPEPWFKD